MKVSGEPYSWPNTKHSASPQISGEVVQVRKVTKPMPVELSTAAESRPDVPLKRAWPVCALDSLAQDFLYGPRLDSSERPAEIAYWSRVASAGDPVRQD
jgi:hypothetical protein